MKREIIITADGSTTIHLPDWNEQYHSKHGAIKEAYHVFIKNGLFHFLNSIQEQEVKPSLSIFEIGFGTGLNAFITFLEAEKLETKVNYVGVEAYPICMEEVLTLNYPERLEAVMHSEAFNAFHESPWNEVQNITSKFSLTKQHKFFNDINDCDNYNIIYFDAFGARVQPELWTETIFRKMYKALKPNGILVTYSAKGSVRRAMQSVGFLVEKLPGPPGKREMLRATRS